MSPGLSRKTKQQKKRTYHIARGDAHIVGFPACSSGSGGGTDGGGDTVGEWCWGERGGRGGGRAGHPANAAANVAGYDFGLAQTYDEHGDERGGDFATTTAQTRNANLGRVHVHDGRTAAPQQSGANRRRQRHDKIGSQRSGVNSRQRLTNTHRYTLSTPKTVGVERAPMTPATVTATAISSAPGENEEGEEAEEELGEEELPNEGNAISPLSSFMEDPPPPPRHKAKAVSVDIPHNGRQQSLQEGHPKWGGFGPSHVPRFFRGRFGVAGEQKRIIGRRVGVVGDLGS